MFDLIGRYFWLAAVAVTLFNHYQGGRAHPPQPSDSSTPAEQQSLRHRVLAASLAPWLVMGFGQVVGRVPSVFHYFRPKDGNPYVWAFYATVFLISLVFAYWVYFQGGAKKAVEIRLMRVTGFRGTLEPTESWVKMFAAVWPPFVVLWVWLISRMDVPPPPG